jgi:hypothetical protein
MGPALQQPDARGPQEMSCTVQQRDDSSRDSPWSASLVPPHQLHRG